MRIKIFGIFSVVLSLIFSEEKKGGDVEKDITGHVLDSYEWHIGGNISVPLPVILLTKDEGLLIFLSSKFEHGKNEYKGFFIREDGRIARKYKSEILNSSLLNFFSRVEGAFVDISFTKHSLFIVMDILIVTILLIFMARYYGNMKNAPEKMIPLGVYRFIEPIVLFVINSLVKEILGPKNYTKFVPYIGTLFLFILVANLVSLLPGAGGPTASINVNGPLALCTLIIVISSAKLAYWKHLINPPGVPLLIKPIIGIIEILSFLIRHSILALRLFGNIFGGHTAYLVIISLPIMLYSSNAIVGIVSSFLSVPIGIFVLGLETFVAFLQAFIFAFLSSIFIGMAIEEEY